MLHTEIVEGTTLELLRRLEREEILSSFCLAGGTALALYLGHRKSVDLDFFTSLPFNVVVLKDFLENNYGLRTDFMEKNTLKGTIKGVKIDCIAHGYTLLGKPYLEEGIRLYSMEDIIAMKLSAITDNGTRLKDFIDIAFLSTRFSFYTMLKCYERKFPNVNVIRALKAVTFFEDIDFGEDVVMLEGNYKWKHIEKRLIDMTKMQDRIFDTFPLKNTN